MLYPRWDSYVIRNSLQIELVILTIFTYNLLVSSKLHHILLAAIYRNKVT
jgi:hypothetical protein